MKYLIISFVWLCIGCNPAENSIRQYDINQAFSGKIKEFYYEKGNRGIPAIVLNDNSKYYTYTYTLCCFAKSGDSIIKTAGSLKYKIATADTTMVFYPESGNTVFLDSNKTTQNSFPNGDCAVWK